MDRIDKALFILPFMPWVDLVSTLLSLTFGGQEVGIVAKPIYERYGELGLVAWASFMFPVLLACVWYIRYKKRKIIPIQILRQASKLERFVLVFAVNIIFFVEGLWIGVVITNLFVPLSLSLHEVIAIWFGVSFAYFVSVSFFTRAEMKRFTKG